MPDSTGYDCAEGNHPVTSEFSEIGFCAVEGVWWGNGGLHGGAPAGAGTLKQSMVGDVGDQVRQHNRVTGRVKKSRIPQSCKSFAAHQCPPSLMAAGPAAILITH